MKQDPYWKELGYDYDERTGLFHMWRVRQDGQSTHEVLLSAECLWDTLRENLRRVRK